MKKPQNNFSTLIRQELVDSFADTVKNEINEFEKTKIETKNSISNIEKSISSLKDDLKAINDSLQYTIQDILEHFLKEKQSLKSEFEEQRRYMKTNVLDCQKHRKEVDDSIVKFIKKQDCEILFNGLNDKISKSDVNNYKNKEELKNYYDSKCKEFLLNLESITKYNCFMFDVINSTLEKHKKNLEEYKITTEGYARENLILKKEIFIMEKKIENLYTLIDRLTGD